MSVVTVGVSCQLCWRKSYDCVGKSVSGRVWRDGVASGCLCQ